MKRLSQALVAVLLVVGCSSDDEASTNPTIPPPVTVTIGEKVTLGGGQTLQVFSYEAGVTADTELATSFEGDDFSVIDAELCGGRGDTVNPSRFRLLMPDNSRVTPSFRVARQPPLEAVSQPGQCDRGTLTFELPATRKPASVSYLANDANIRWRLA